MAEVEGGDNLSEELPGLFGGQPALLNQVVEQLSARHMLQNQIPGEGAGGPRSQATALGEDREESLVSERCKNLCAESMNASSVQKKLKHTPTALYISHVMWLFISVLLYRSYFPFQIQGCSFSGVDPGRRLKKKKKESKTVSGKQKENEILTGICYSHRRHAASEREGALLV